MMAGSQDVNKTRPGGTRVDPFSGPPWVLHFLGPAMKRALTVNTAAAGGNTALLSLEEGDVL